MEKHRLLTFAVAAATVLGLALDTADAGESTRSGAALKRALQTLVDRPDGPPGVIVEIQRGAKTFVFTAGGAEVSCHAFGSSGCVPVRSPRASDHMRIASVSKAFSGAAALGLVSDGLLDLDDTIGDRLPDLPDDWHDVTLRQLLNHTSGLPDFTASKAFVARVVSQPTNPPPPRRLLGYVGDEPLNFPPGSDYRYSNSDNVAVGLMVESVTGRPYARELDEAIFGPLDMQRSDLPRDVELPMPFIHGYSIEPDGTNEDVSESYAYGGYAWASGGIVSTPDDLSTFVRAYVGGDLFGRPERKAQFDFVAGGKSSPPGPGRNAAGLSLFRYETRCGTVYGHTGSITGYTQFMAATKDRSRSVTFSINTQAAKTLIPALRKAQRKAVCFALAR